MTRGDGTPVNAVFGFTNMMARLLREHVGTHLAVIFDAGRTTFRNELYGEYKAHRPAPPDELVPQFALVREAVAAFGVPSIELPGWEADDLIAAYAAAVVEAGGRATIVSSDKDLMQLVSDRVTMLDPIKQKPIGPAEVRERFGVGPDKVVEVQALMGDAIDNVPGVPGIGPKGAALLVGEFGDLEGVLAAAPAMKASKRRDLLIAHAEAARLSRTLVVLRADAPLPSPIEALAVRAPDRAALGAWLHGMGFRSTAQRLGLDDAPPAATEPHAPAEAPGFGPYPVVADPAALAPYLAEASASGIVSLALETAESGLLGIGLAVAPGRACYVPTGHAPAGPEAPSPSLMPVPALLDALAPLLADPGVLKLFHDAKEALLALDRARLGPVAAAPGAPDLFAEADLPGVAPPPPGPKLVVAPIDDVMLISYAQTAGRHGQGIEELSALHLEHAPASRDGVTGTGRARLPLARTAPEAAAPWLAGRAEVALRLWHLLRPSLRENRSLALYEQVERRMIPVLAAMEHAGVAVDADELRRLSADFGARMAVMERDIHALAGRPFNLGSAKQLGEILFDEMKLSGGKRMATGAWGTDAGVLQGLADAGNALPARVLEWRQLAKLKSTYADSLLAELDPATGRVHTRFVMAATSTGRLSSTEPNLQNIPIRTEEGGRIRRAFVAAPGHVLVSADYSQIELRLLAHVADIPALRDAFREGQDIHARTASEVFGVPMEGMDPLTRRRAKAINFGIIYGISAFGLGRQLGIEPGEARLYIEAYFARYPGIRDYMERTREEARIAGYVLTPFGRRCWIPGIADRNAAKRAYAERQATNAPLQGGAADIVKRAMVRLPGAMEAAGLTARLLLQVHDELLFEAAEDQAESLAALARSEMEAAARLDVPLVAETGIGRSWAEAH